MRLYTWDSGALSGVDNMAWDEALLEWLRESPETAWVVRTYQWQPATWSVGCHQSDASVVKACQGLENQPVVKRPTGGRAINHKGDQSLAIVTNDSAVWKLPLAQRYPALMAPTHQALSSCCFTPYASNQSDTSAYTRSDQCFETTTPWDVKDADGVKRLGCAQLQRNGGVLHHGALFWPPTMNITSEQWLAALELAVGQQLHQDGHNVLLQPLPLADERLQAHYQKAHQKIAAESLRLEAFVAESLT